MDKEVYKSKTVWGVFLFALSTAAVGFGWIEPGTVSVLGQGVGTILGGWGIRDALD